MLTRIKDLSESEWIGKQRLSFQDDPNREGNYVAHCIPPLFEAYTKVFHNMYEDTSVDDHDMTWDDIDKLRPMDPNDPIEKLRQSSKAVYGGEVPLDDEKLVRIRWSDLAGRYGLKFHAELNADSFTRNFPTRSWPRYLIGPDEGSLESSTCGEIVRSIAAFSSDPELTQDCYFRYELIATLDYENDLLFSGPLNAIFETYELDVVSGTPTYWWPSDRSWLVCSDWDLTFTLVGGTHEFIQSLTANPELETESVDPSSRIDDRSDTLNL